VLDGESIAAIMCSSIEGMVCSRREVLKLRYSIYNNNSHGKNEEGLNT